MSAHRFRALSEQVITTSRDSVASPAAFMPCPSPMLLACTPVQQTWITEIYRIALEQTQAMLQPPQSRQPQFSLN